MKKLYQNASGIKIWRIRFLISRPARTFAVRFLEPFPPEILFNPNVGSNSLFNLLDSSHSTCNGFHSCKFSICSVILRGFITAPLSAIVGGEQTSSPTESRSLMILLSKRQERSVRASLSIQDQDILRLREN
jgi:hypothetical protein